MTEIPTLRSQFTLPNKPNDLELAKLALRCLDLTSLTGQESEDDIAALVKKATIDGDHHAAAICVYPQYVELLNDLLRDADSAVKIAAVINFPNGEASNKAQADAPQDLDALLADMDAEIRHIRNHGADEIDIVFPRQSFLAGDLDRCAAIIGRAAALCHDDKYFYLRLKVILESSAFTDKAQLRAACDFALEHGADVLKTSTGKHPSGGADIVSAQVLLDAVMTHDLREHLGVKISGGVKTLDDVATYAKLAEGSGLPLTPDYFRFGASGLLSEIQRAFGVTGDSTGTAPALGNY